MLDSQQDGKVAKCHYAHFETDSEVQYVVAEEKALNQAIQRICWCIARLSREQLGTELIITSTVHCICIPRWRLLEWRDRVHLFLKSEIFETSLNFPGLARPRV